MKKAIKILFSIFLSLFATACFNNDDGGNGGSTKPLYNMSGTWDGIWKSNQGSSGVFTADINQQDSTLSGTISVPDIPLFSAPLTGQVNGNNISFGDINNTITFTGTLASDTSASGKDSIQ